MTEPMILIVASGVLTSLLGAGFGCLVLELTLRALAHSLNEPSRAPRARYALSRRRLSVHSEDLNND